MNYEVTTRPAPVVSLAEARAWLRIDHTYDDDIIEDVLIPAAQERIETATGLAMSPGTVIELTISAGENDGSIIVPLAPITEADVEFSGDTLLSTEGTDQKITYTAGFTECPPDLKLAILNQISHDFDNRATSELAPKAKATVQLRTRNLMI